MGFEPPKTLVPAAAMAPPVITKDPADPIVTPQASATRHPGAKKTAAVWNPIPLPSPVQHAPLPKETNHIPAIRPQTSQTKPVDNDPGAKDQNPFQQGSGSTDPSGQSNIQSSSSGVPKMRGDLSGQSTVQAGSSESSNVSGDSKQGGPKDPGDNQGRNPFKLLPIQRPHRALRTRVQTLEFQPPNRMPPL